MNARVTFAALLLALCAAADPFSAEDLRSAVADLGSDTPEVRAEARRTIMKWGERDPEALEKALPLTSPDIEAGAALGEIHKALKAAISIRKRSDRVLAACGQDAGLVAATKGLLEQLNDPAFLEPADDSPVRLPQTDGVLTPYVLATYQSGKPGVCRVMEALLFDGSLGVRRIAARILYYHGSAANEKALVASMADEDPYIRGCAALTLSHYQVKSSEGAIKKMLQDPDPVVQQHAATALQELGAVIDDKDLDAMLGSKDASVRLRGVQSYVSRNDPAVLDKIGALTDDPDRSVRRAVVDAMASLGGFSWDPEESRSQAAKDWWAKRKK